MQLPRNYLSYSAISLWYSDREGFRMKYYEGIEPPGTDYTIYGSEIHKKIERGELAVKDHPREKYKSEVRVEAEVDGIPVLGYLDLFNPKTKAVSDIKTGIPRPDGKPRWTQSEVQKLDQLPFYHLIVREHYGKVQKTAKLIWLVTEWEEYCDTVEFDGMVLPSDTKRRLNLTGEQHVFSRKIDEWELDRQREKLKRAAKEISDDYQWYLHKKTV
jgi:hypothetical protein